MFHVLLFVATFQGAVASFYATPPSNTAKWSFEHTAMHRPKPQKQFTIHQSMQNTLEQRASKLSRLYNDNNVNIADISVSAEELASIKLELTEYLAKRTELGGDDAAKASVGKIVGGTKGNKVLEYVSGSPNKAYVIETAAEPFDYDELTKYGYSSLVTRIMNAGGRLAMYDLMGMDPPPPPKRPERVSAPELVIDLTGENDETMYSGLKLNTLLDDDAMGEALLNVQRKLEKGETLQTDAERAVGAYVQPFADKRNVGPKQTPDWTVDELDEWGKKQGRVEAWARKARDGAFVQDPAESLYSLTSIQRFYSILVAVTVSFAFGRSTVPFLQLAGADEFTGILELIQIPALVGGLVAMGSGLYCGVSSGSKNRNQVVWFIKGCLGGPLAVQQFAALSTLITQKEQDDETKKSSA